MIKMGIVDGEKLHLIGFSPECVLICVFKELFHTTQSYSQYKTHPEKHISNEIYFYKEQ